MSDCGCDEFANLADVEDEAATDADPDPRGTTVRVFRDQLIAPYGKPTGDKRRFAAGALSSRELPIPVKWQRADSQGHSTSIGVGRLDALRYADDGVYASGIIFSPDPEVTPRWAEDCAEAYGLLKEKVIGPSVDLDAMDFQEYAGADAVPADPADFAQGERPEIEVTKGRISAVTLVQIPAFVEARPFSIDEQDADEYATTLEAVTVLTAAGVYMHDEDMKVATEEWDFGHWLEHAIDIEGAALYDGPDAVAPYFPVADLVDGELQLFPAAIADAISVFAYQGDQVDIPEGAKQCIRARLEDLAVIADLPTPPWIEREPSLVAAGTIQGWLPPRDAFEDPHLTAPTPIAIRDGRIVGHLADWRTCHIGFRDCRRAPRSRSNYAYFHVGEIETDAGPLAVGKITLGGGHADPDLGFRAAAEHYDDAGTATAVVRAGEDRHGIWIAGVAIPGAEDKFATLPLYPLSGDWRRVGGHLEMIAALAVNTPGFGITRVNAERGRELSLVAAGMLEEYKVISKAVRDKAAEAGHANPDGSYPIENVADLENAIQAYGRAKNKPQTRALIMRRAKQLNREDLIPESWRGEHANDYATDEEILEACRLEWVAELAAGAFSEDTLTADAGFEGKHKRGFHGRFITKLLGHHMGDGKDAGAGGRMHPLVEMEQRHRGNLTGQGPYGQQGNISQAEAHRRRVGVAPGYTPSERRSTAVSMNRPGRTISEQRSAMERPDEPMEFQPPRLKKLAPAGPSLDDVRRADALERKAHSTTGLTRAERHELEELRNKAREARLNNPDNFSDADEAIKTYRQEHETMRLARIVADGLDELDDAQVAEAALSASTAF